MITNDTWCSRCELPATVELKRGDETVALCKAHAEEETWKANATSWKRGPGLDPAFMFEQEDPTTGDEIEPPKMDTTRCYECGEPFQYDASGCATPGNEQAEVYLDVDTIRANAGGQDVLVDDIPESEFGPFLVHADPCYSTTVAGRPKYTLA